MSDKLGVILVELQRMNTEFQKINQRMDLLEAGQKETNQIVRALHDDQKELKAQIEGIYTVFSCFTQMPVQQRQHIQKSFHFSNRKIEAFLQTHYLERIVRSIKYPSVLYGVS